MRILNFTFIVQAAPSDLNRYNDPVGLFISEYLGISNSTHVRPGSTDFSANPPPLLLPVSVNDLLPTHSNQKPRDHSRVLPRPHPIITPY